ncbi:PstS family phosphate ABC transporter substrate-binding protein [Oleomonas cavernae]|uniref:PstS family phosphate ABC transporter substrate-binding protein n=1 Tax=Oleomonas cavernae TaxID=2320859 RepID=A0A418WHQ8_9PROT|nr:PstS family phosphate ABC transporter substrate-binding protein [Oleomonas cavernae]RJF89530.1 PstS family phosphate ABC transporter substrate-binding protein [Oleomonas cavernae]
MTVKSALAAVATAAILATGFAATAQARDQIRVVGSSTVFPFATAVAETFGKGGAFKTPIVESTGTGGGLKLFCAGVGENYPDIANASRRIKRSEIDQCQANGVQDIVELKIGYDGIVLANAKSAPAFKLTRAQIWKALAAEVVVDGDVVDNPYKTWNEIDPSLPAEKIEVLGPPPTSGTRDAFNELVMDEGCKEVAENKDLITGKACQKIREDGGYVEAGENDNLIVQKLVANPIAVGVFGYSFLEENQDKIKGATVDGKQPTYENIQGGAYPVSRSLYFYVKKYQVGDVPGIAEYIAEFFSDRAIAANGYLEGKGLILLSADELAKQRAVAKGLDSLDTSAF